MPIQKITIHQSESINLMNRQHPLLEVNQSSKNRFAELAGGTTAECAVVCCCIPLSLVNLFVMAVYGVPSGLLKKVLRKKRRRKVVDNGDYSSHDRSDGSEMLISSPEMETVDLSEFEEEMWRKFYGTGFWRSVSQRVD